MIPHIMTPHVVGPRYNDEDPNAGAPDGWCEDCHGEGSTAVMDSLGNEINYPCNSCNGTGCAR